MTKLNLKPYRYIKLQISLSQMDEFDVERKSHTCFYCFSKESDVEAMRHQPLNSRERVRAPLFGTSFA